MLSSPRWLWRLGLAAVPLMLFACYLRLSEAYPLNGDGASIALQAWDMLHGNWLLHGWMLNDVTFYTTEVPEYALVEAVHGLNQGDVHIASAVTYTLLVVLAALLAKGKATGREGRVRALLAAGIMLAPMPGIGFRLLLSQPDHLGTQVPLLAIFLLLDQAPRRWYVPSLTAVVLAWVVVADTVAVLAAAAPIAVVLFVRTAWAVFRRGDRLAAHRYELCLAAAATIGAGAGAGVQQLILRLGGFRMIPLTPGMTALAAIPSHLWVTCQAILALYGADVVGSPPGTQTTLAWLHMAGVALAVAAFLLGFRGFLRSTDPIPAILATGIAINVAFFVASNIPARAWDAREIAAALPFGAVLAGRILARPLTRARLVPLLGVALTCSLYALVYGMAQPTADRYPLALASWLEAHHLSTGLGTYNEDNPLTVDSGGRIHMLTASWKPAGPSVPRWYESSLGWYDPRSGYANFVVTTTGMGVNGLIPSRDIVQTFGEPARTYHYLNFTIMVWQKNLLQDLGRPATTWVGYLG